MKNKFKLDSFHLFISICFILISIPLVYSQLQDYFFKPHLVLATKDIITYPMVGDPPVLSKTTRHIIGVALQNFGHKAAHNVLVHFPTNYPYNGWIVRGDISGQEKMDFTRGTYKFSSLSAGESISFFIYMAPYAGSFLDKIEAYYDGGKVARHVYLAVNSNHNNIFHVPPWYSWLSRAFLLLIVIVVIVEIIRPGSSIFKSLK